MKKHLLKISAVALCAAAALFAQENAVTAPAPAPATAPAPEMRPAMPADARPSPKARVAGGTFLDRVRMDAAELHDMYDANCDGVLDEQERARMEADFAIANRLSKYLRTKPVIDALDADHNMKISVEEGKRIREVTRELQRQNRRPAK